MTLSDDAPHRSPSTPSTPSTGPGSPVSDGFGTLAWGERSGGRLNRREQIWMAFQGVAAVLRSKWPGGAAPGVSLAVVHPSSPAAGAAEALLASTSPPWLVHHGYRTYAWAWALAERDGLRPDPEVLYAASLLHDLGITPAFMPSAGDCFALSGARGAEPALVGAGMLPDRARRTAEAIALHLNLVVKLDEHGPEAHLLRAATALDVAGQDFARIDDAFRTRTLREFPRLAFKEEVGRALATQAAHAPRTRIGFLCRRLQLVDRVRAAPFAA